MKSNYKSIVALFMALVMCLFVTTACGNASQNVASESVGGSGSNIAAENDTNSETESPAESETLTCSLSLSLDEWPVIDGATAFLPYYSGMAALMLGLDDEEAGAYVLCNTTDFAYPNLYNGDADMVFCLRPSEDQIREAQNVGVTFEEVPILNEGFVFFVNKSNPVDSLTVQQLHDIYAGKITNWKEVGGNDEAITPYQRSEGSGSQTGLYLHVISPDEVMEPITENRIGTMGEIVDAVASYDNASSAIGYSYYYFVTNQHFENEIKLLKINGVEPNMESISSGEYPMISETCAVFRSSEPEDSIVRKIAQWCVSEEGQKLGTVKGYVPLKRDTE